VAGEFRHRARHALLSRPTTAAAGTGFCLAALTGLGLLATKATEYADNPFIFIKFPAIALGLANVALLSRTTAWKAHRSRELTAAEQSRLAWIAGLSLACWLTAISAGRLIGYW